MLVTGVFRQLNMGTIHAKKVLISLSFVLFVFLTSGCAVKNLNVERTAVNTSVWKTHTIGRFLIDLPPDAECKYSALFWKAPITWRKDLTIDTARGEAKKLAEQYKNTPHKKLSGQSMLIDLIDLPGGGLAIHRWSHDFATGMTCFDVYFISQDSQKRVFFYSKTADVDHLEQGKQLITEMASSLISLDEYSPLPTEPGFAFEGGFSKHIGAWRAERSTVAFTLPEYPGIKGYFACYGFGTTQKLMFERGDNEQLAEGFRSKATVLRKGDCSLGGIPGQELGLAATEKGRRAYLFDMEAPGQGKDIARPMLVLHMESENNGTDGGFSSDEQAVGVWNAIRDSIRLRPGAV